MKDLIKIKLINVGKTNYNIVLRKSVFLFTSGIVFAIYVVINYS